MLAYCGPSENLTTPWQERGFSHCFLSTVAMSIMFGFMAVGGTVQIILYWKYARVLHRKFQPPSCLYILQLVAAVSMAIESVIKVALEASIIGDRKVYGYQVLRVCCSVAMWLFSFVLLRLERKQLLRRLPSKGHGLILLLFWTLAFLHENLAFASWASRHWWWYQRSQSESAQMGLWMTRYTCTAILFFLGFKAPGLPDRDFYKKHPRETVLEVDEEIGLKKGSGDGEDLPEEPERAKVNESTWADMKDKLVVLLPYAWPKKDKILQLTVLVCAGLLVAGRFVNLFIPIYGKYIVDSLMVESSGDSPAMKAGRGGSLASPGAPAIVNNDTQIGGSESVVLPFRWDYVLIYVALRFLQGAGGGMMGLLNNLRNLLWIRVQQYTVREVGVSLISHLHGLSLGWHLSRKTGEVLRIMDRGTVSVNSLLNYILFQIVPTIVDIIIAIIYFLTQFNIWFAIIVFVTMAMYLVFTVMVTEWRTKFRRTMNKRDNERNAHGVDSILNFETVKYYGAEDYEVNRYRESVLMYQRSEWTATAGLNMLNSLQNLIITIGFAAGCLLCVWYICRGMHGMTAGDYVLFSTYILQLYMPLNQLGMFYRAIQQAFIDMENMFELLHEEHEVKDNPEATALQVKQGRIEFKDISFQYLPGKPVLKNISFVVHPGQTLALVGPSGSGKSTIIRLMFRFYDPASGQIIFDDQDITQVTQSSLRQSIGVVPQDTVLFNDDIRFNIRYGRIEASDDEVEEAARAADIHERILTFVDGYDTKVGERGLKLSGGEKQRVAIARTILKAPKVVLLDEATSALDTQTERNIQASLALVCENKTTIIVAHRLSTIIHANQILVLKDGEIAERGTHEALLSQHGIYSDMWHQQLNKREVTVDREEELPRRRGPPNGERNGARGRGKSGGKGRGREGDGVDFTDGL